MNKLLLQNTLTHYYLCFKVICACRLSVWFITDMSLFKTSFYKDKSTFYISN